MITADMQTLEPGQVVELFEVDATALGGEQHFFHGYNRQEPILWQGNEYTPWPLKASGFEMTSQGRAPTPNLQLGNVGGFITALCLTFDDLAGAKVIRHRTLGKYLDGMPEADPTEEFAQDIWYVEQKKGESSQQVSFDLSSAMNVNGLQLPRRQIIANNCPWAYRGPDCGYTGPPVADEYDIITTDAAKDKCGRRVISCKLRFGETGELAYGGFAAAGLTR